MGTQLLTKFKNRLLKLSYPTLLALSQVGNSVVSTFSPPTSAQRYFFTNSELKAMSIVICNSGPLMALGKLNRLDLLAELYDKIQIPLE
ncbi:MAG: hypothetical protein GY847_29235 [Proteobacteria bacterium]|nr:hypothetical protein [Pseudomonadota bacterium]